MKHNLIFCITCDDQSIGFRCSWKGESCSADDFQTIFTDLGLCYKFTPPTKVEKSGTFCMEYVTTEIGYVYYGVCYNIIVWLVIDYF